MKYYEMFRSHPPEAQIRLLNDLLTADKPAYNAAIEALAPAANVRPVFVQRMPPPKRHAWLVKMLSRKSSEALTGNVIQLWLTACRRDMLRDFLDQLGIEHEDGMIESLPEAPPEGRLQPAVEHLLAAFPQDDVLLYLRAFQAMELADWPEMDALISSLATV